MHDDTSRGFPWFKLVLGSISILVLVGTFGGFMWLLRTYVDPPRVATGPSAAALLASVSNPMTSDPAEPRVVSTSRGDAQISPASRTEPGLPPPSEPYERAPPPPNAGAPIPSSIPSWASSPLPNVPRLFSVASSPSSSSDAAAGHSSAPAEAGTVSFNGPVPLPRPKPRVVARAPAPNLPAPTAITPPRPKPPA